MPPYVSVVRFLAIAVLLGIGATLSASPVRAAADGPDVVASIKPVNSLVAAVMQGVGTPHLIVRGAGSPHTYSMKPTDARALQQAQVVFWIGPGLEAFLARPLATLARDATVVSLADAPGLVKLPARDGGGHGGEDDTHHGGHGVINMHLWLDPMNAKAMVHRIALALAAVDPANAARYQRNADAEAANLDALTAELATRLAPVQHVPFVVFHDAFQYFEHRFGLNDVGSITASPAAIPGAKRVAAVRDRVRELDAVCVFSEPEFEPRLVRAVIEGSGARTGVLDPLGAALPDGPGLYVRLLRAMATSYADCLGPGR